ncbi:MAG: MFS transporter, partial [Pseudomonadota bacterium]
MSETAITSAARPHWSTIIAWCFYDWANSAFNTVVLTFVFSIYFAKGIIGDEAAGSGQWAFAIGLAGLIVAVTSPVLGAIADHAGDRKPWLAVFTAITVMATAALWFAEPDPSFALYVLVLVIIASVAFEWGQVFYNAILTSVAPPAMTGRVSGWGWGFGYFGGLGCLALCLALLIQPDPPLFGLDAGPQEPVRATALLVAAWFGLFSLPLFLMPLSRPGIDVTGVGLGQSVSLGQAVRLGLQQLRQSLGQLWQQRNLLRFLIA